MKTTSKLGIVIFTLVFGLSFNSFVDAQKWELEWLPDFREKTKGVYVNEKTNERVSLATFTKLVRKKNEDTGKPGVDVVIEKKSGKKTKVSLAGFQISSPEASADLDYDVIFISLGGKSIVLDPPISLPAKKGDPIRNVDVGLGRRPATKVATKVKQPGKLVLINKKTGERLGLGTLCRSVDRPGIASGKKPIKQNSGK